MLKTSVYTSDYANKLFKFITMSNVTFNYTKIEQIEILRLNVLTFLCQDYIQVGFMFLYTNYQSM